ncbi:hypothetical protein P43SY_007367 [Pythium insidiosum]|uniref:Bromo domain-containing protein n=1 Tax=Pythium insidiosum TaxID=114742 RepID=A0AAD5MCK5_PYTIN|nr:hypothetical protein P43SY_007367 [Pythium insidiosum]
METAYADPDGFYLLRGAASLDAEDVNCRDLMKHFKLESHRAKMADASLPTTYSHLLRGVGEHSAAANVKGDLVSLLQGVPFDRPIEPFAESVIKSALQLPPGSKQGPVLHPMSKDRKTPGLIHAPPSSLAERQQMEEKLKGKGKEDKDKKEKKEKKKEKRKREDAQMLQKVLVPLISELRALTWSAWIVSGKPGNPFLQKITKENCRRLGVPNYFDFVAEPMDLTRVKEKVEKAEYYSIQQFTSDIKLMVQNAKTFNRVGEPVHQMAIELEQLYEAKVVSYAATFDELQQERKKRKKEKKKKKDKKKDKA